MKTLMVVKASQVPEKSHLLGGQRIYLAKLALSLQRIMIQEEIQTVQIICNDSWSSRSSIGPLEHLSRNLVRLSRNIDSETSARTFPKTLNFVQDYAHNDAVILVCEGNLADRFTAYYGKRILGLNDLDNDPIVPTCCRMLNCETGQVALVY